MAAIKTRGGVDSTGFKRGVTAQRRAFKLSASEVLTKQGRLLVRDLIKLTPGFDPKRGIQVQSYGWQKAVSDSAVKHDIRKIFQPIDQSGIYKDDKRAGKRLRELLTGVKRSARAIAGGLGGAKGGRAASRIGNNKEAIAAIFKAATGRNFLVIDKATRQLHITNRGKRGRTKTPNGNPYLVIDGRSVAALTRETLTHVGRGKAGWATAAAKLGGPQLPAWISRHSTPGGFIDERKAYPAPSITVINSVPYRRDFETTRIVQAALTIRAASMRTEIKKVQEYQARAFNQKR